MRRYHSLPLAIFGIAALLSACDSTVEVEETRIIRLAHQARGGLEVETVAGSVSLGRSEGEGDVVIRARVRALGQSELRARRRLARVEIDVERRSDGRIVLGATWPDQRQHGDRVSFEISAPRLHDIRLRTSSGTLTVADHSGPIRIDSRIGSVRVRQHRGEVKAFTQSGAIRLDRVLGNVEASSERGSIRVDRLVGRADLESESGSIRYRAGAANTHPLKIRTENGRISALVSSEMRGRVTCQSERGRVTLAKKLRRRVKVLESDRRRKVFRLTRSGPPSEIKSRRGSISVSF